MYKKSLVSILITSLIVGLLSFNISAYSLKTYGSTTNIFPYYINTSVPTSARYGIKQAAIGLSNYKWGSTLVFSYKGTKSSSMSCSDNRSEIAYINMVELAEQSEWAFLGSCKYSTAVCITKIPSYEYFDIILNSVYGSLWGNGSGSVTYNGIEYCIIDYQGITTHELGHSAGLADMHWVPTTETYPTMFFETKVCPSDFGAPHAFEFRTLEPDDIRGLNELGY